MQDYTVLNLDSRLRSNNCIANRFSQPVTGMEFESQYEVQGAYVNTSKINLVDFVKRSVGGTALGTFSTSQALNLTAYLNYDAPHKNVRTFGKAVVSIYQGAGTLTANQIYPIRGANVTLGRYDVVGGELDYASYDGTADRWRAMIIDTNGTSTQSITFAADFIYLDYKTRSGAIFN